MIDITTAHKLARRIHNLKCFDDYEAADIEQTTDDTAETIANAPEVVISYLLDMLEDYEA